MNKKPHKLYALIKNDNPIYIGVTCCLTSRLKKHKIDKDFDSFIVIKSYENRKEALNAECGIIRYLSLFRNEFNINAKYEILCYQAMKRRYNG